MRETRTVMGMPATIEVVDSQVKQADLDRAYDHLTYVDETFSTYKDTSEISRINAGVISEKDWSTDMRHVMDMCEQTKRETDGFFDISHDGKLDPSGYVKGWAIQNVADQLSAAGFKNYYVEVAGDIQVAGRNAGGAPWIIGIQNPFNLSEIVRHIALENKGIATSGTALRGQHIYNPQNPDETLTEIVSMTVIGKRIVDADCFATAAFAMGRQGIYFIEQLEGFEGYMIDSEGIATYTSNFS